MNPVGSATMSYREISLLPMPCSGTPSHSLAATPAGRARATLFPSATIRAPRDSLTWGGDGGAGG
eukprot:4789859-Prymnesium_polylepis.1